MEGLVWMLLFIAVLCCVLYFVVKAAVRDGILEARRAAGQEEPGPEAPGSQSGENKKEGG